ncbi:MULTISPECIES: hypothetical protein [Streptomyces]|uniref:hypothetical protein n=1 Tax=Streptomyces TaxID=1883 RepID=UPI00025CBFA2|nr:MULTISPECIES: hypothetical protein [Streptomyces]AZK97711.1 hypothetical protein B7R87_30340 [Streptomyces tsukubensis]EIF93897.1 hypothetical protein [Streptomyces tsukubensis NRRL18488]
MGITAKNSLTGAALVFGAPLALWGLMGQQDDSTAAQSELTYALEPIRALEGWATGLGIVALLITGLSALYLVRATLSGALDPRRWFVLLPLAAAGVVVAWSHRVLTAGTADANIGAGLAVFFGTPIAAGLLLAALIQTIRLRDGRGTGRAGPAAC